MSKPAILCFAAAAAFVTLGSAHAAGAMRVWVSGHGTDAAGCGAPTTPCRSLQYAHDSVVAAGGEIDILDPAGYGAVTITKSISIVNDGVGTAGVQQATPGLDAVIIDAASTDAITLRGLSIEGLGVAQDGIALIDAGSLTVTNCVIRHFAHDGLYLVPTSGTMRLTVLNTAAADNLNDGFDISPVDTASVTGVIDHSAATNNGHDGVVAWGANSPAGQAFLAVSNSVIANNGQYGIYLKGATSTVNAIVSASNDVVDFDALYGFYADSNSSIIYAKSEFIGETESGFVAAGSNAYTQGDNTAGLVSGTVTQYPPS